MKILVLVSAIMAFAGAAFAQLPQCSTVAGWQQQGKERAYTTDDLFEYMNGNSEGYFIYRFVSMKGITCQSGDSTIMRPSRSTTATSPPSLFW